MTNTVEKNAMASDGNEFEKEIKRFAESIDSLLMSLPNVMATMDATVQKQSADFLALLKSAGAEQVVEDKTIRFTLKGTGVAKVVKMQRSLENNQTAYRLIHRSFLTSQISQYDAYLGRLLRLVYLVHPEKLNSSEKQFTFKELVQYASLEEAREALIEREVDTVVRKSHEDQINWIKANLKLPVSDFIPELPDFIEIAQRRHLFVHCDGVVSAPYIANCKSAGVKLTTEIETGHQLEVSRQYLENAFEVVYAVGVKVGFALWLNLCKADVDQAAKCVNALAYDLISNARYSLAINLLEFSIAGKQKPAQEQIFRFIILNLAQSYKWSGNKEKCVKLLAGYDWSASSDLIKLGVAVLTENFEEAFRLMKKLGHDDEFKKENYRDWPIFRELRKQPNFPVCYHEIYKEDYEQATVVSADLQTPLLLPAKAPSSAGVR